MGGRRFRRAARFALLAPLAACLESPPQRGEPSCGVADDIAEIALGRDHACARLENGGVWCWGQNEQGQLGDGSEIDRSAPSQVAGLRDVVVLAVGQDHSCAAQSDGVAWCWGSGSNGQLGNRSTSDSAVPVQVDLPGIVDLALGDDFSCAVAGEGAVYCWGENEHGQGGPELSEELTDPTRIEIAGTALSVAVGENHGCALLEGGRVACWGSDEFGQLGDGMMADNPAGRAIPGLDSIARVFSGRNHACAVGDEGGLWCWGATESGQLATFADNPGDPCTNGEGVPISCVPRAIEVGDDVVAGAAGLGHTCAVTAGGEVLCFGANQAGQLGNGGFGDNEQPLAVQIEGDVVEVAAGETQNCATTKPGSVYCWGSNRAGQLAQTASLIATEPVPVVGGDGARSIAAGAQHTCLARDNDIMCWGRNDSAQLGDGSLQSSSSPTMVGDVAGSVEQLVLGEEHSCYLNGSEQLRCWGRNSHGELGPSAENEIEPTPVSVGGLGGGVSQADGGDEHTCAVRTDGALLCWGSDSAGQLGNGAAPSGGPDLVELDLATEVAAGDEHTCALLTPGYINCWGANDSGQLGDNSTAERLAPGTSLGLAADRIASGEDFSCALSVGAVFCWGDNAFGEVGLAGQERSLVPFLIAGLPQTSQIALGAEHACAIVGTGEDNRVMCWGRNDGGQLGNGTTDSSHTPVAVELPDTPLAIAAGERHTCALVSGGAVDDKVYCWGSDVDGALGSGRDLYYPTAIGPIAVCP